MKKKDSDSQAESTNTSGDGNVLPDNVGNGVSAPSPTSPNPFAAFDPVNLRIDQSFLNHGVAKKLLTTLPIRKPNKQDFVRVHPSEEYRLTAALIELKEDRETYLVMPGFIRQLGEAEYFLATLYLCINRQKVLSFWPVKLPGPDGRQMEWHTSAADAAEKAMKVWIRVTANMSLGAYEISEAAANLSEPEWPEQTMPELLSIAFKNRVIEGPDHPVMKKLAGEI
jgi:hypothetical protein